MSVLYQSVIYGNAAATCTDSSGNGNHATFAGAVQDAPNPTISFTNPSSAMFTPNGTIIFPTFGTNWTTAAFSVSFWINIKDKIGASGDDVFSYYTSSTPKGLNISHSFSGNGKLRILLRRAGADIFAPFQTTTAMTFGTWYHVAMTYDASGAGAFKVYFNGTQDASSGTGSTFPDAFTPNTKSINKGVSGQSGIIQIDDFRIYTKALSSSEVSTLATGATGLTDSTLYAWYKMDNSNMSQIMS